jgi:hypothetical protein
MPVERPDWRDGEPSRVLTEVPLGSSVVVSDEEKAAMLAEVEAVGEAGTADSVASEQLETYGPIAVTLCSELPEAEVNAICDEFDALPQETREWVAGVVAAMPHANLKRIVKELKSKATLEHAASMRAVGW